MCRQLCAAQFRPKLGVGVVVAIVAVKVIEQLAQLLKGFIVNAAAVLQFRKRFGPTSAVVPPRILSMTVPASNLKLARYHLSRALGAAKERYAKPPAEGIHERFGPTPS